MHEAFLAAGARKLVYPNSGPGPITAVGTDDVAYFGEVSNAEVLTADEFKSQITEFSMATVTNDDIPWLKFRYYGKFLFIKKQAIFKQTSGAFLTNWSQLYAAGLIYGVDGVGPDFVPDSKVNQIRIVKKGSYSFKVRTITGDETEAATQPFTSNGSDTSPRRKSMFTELMYRVVSGDIPNYPEKKFEKYTWSDVIGNIEINREISIGSSAPAGTPLLRGSFNASSPIYITGYSLQAGTTLSNAYNWRPVLELIAANELFNLASYRISVNGILRTAVSGLQFGTTSGGSETSVLRLTDYSTGANFQKPAGGITYETYDSPYRLSDYKTSSNLSKPVGVPSVTTSGDPARLLAIFPAQKPVVRVSMVSFTI